MSGIELTKLTVLLVFAVNGLLMLGLITLKTIHRRRVKDHDRRRAEYVGLLSRHLSFENCTDAITTGMVEDPAFLDALIDVRSALAGPEVQTLHGIVNRHGIVSRQAGRLKRRFPLGRRLQAVVALAEMGDESAAAILMDHLDDREPEIRIQCARGLARIQWTPAIDTIVERLTIETPWVLSQFADTLVGFGSNATWPLVAYVRVNHHHEIAASAMAIRTLAVIGDDQATPPLMEILEKADQGEIQIAAVEALGLLGSPMALEPLLRALAWDDWRVRAKAATALGEIGDRSAVSALARRLTDRSWWVRRNSAAALAHISGGIDELYAALEGVDRHAADAAAEALADAGELVAARRRIESGQATDRDLTLLNHMIGAASVTA